MKAIRIIMIGLITAFMMSCGESAKDEQSQVEENVAELKGEKEVITVNMESTPISSIQVTPYLIPGENNGGNRTCAEVGLAFMGDANYFAHCGDKVDYDDGMFIGGFPEGLNVTVEGNFVSFSTDGCIEMNGSSYKVGAVIVKGSNNANVYFYEGGTYHDSGLAAPGGNRMVSNLTFCFVECEDEEEELIIAVKSYYYNENNNLTWCASIGQYEFNTPQGYWCNFTGYNYYPSTTSFDMHKDYSLSTIIGNTAVTEGNNSLIVTINLGEGLTVERSWVFVGTLDEFKSNLTSDGCPDYDLWTLNYEMGNPVSIEVPL